jgi:N-methylhydantoinase B
MMPDGSGMQHVPCEVIEKTFPLWVERSALRPDSGGPGRRRGGLGVQTDIRILAEGTRLSVGMDRCRFAPPGLGGGGPGARSQLLLIKGDGQAEEIRKVAGLPLGAGWRPSHRSGGGGLGPPFEREPELVQADVQQGYVLLAAARSGYRVALDPATPEIDRAETHHLRAASR